MHGRSQVNRNLLKNNYTESNMPQNYVLPFFSKTFCMTIKSLKIAAKMIFINRKINLNIQNLKIIPYNQKKMQIQYDTLFLQFSIDMWIN